MQPKIVGNIRMDSENCETNVCGDTIEEIVKKIKEYHTASSFEIDHYTKKGKQKILYSGWWFKKGLPKP
jgi:hypothetical protein